MDSYHVIILSNPYLSAHVARSWCVPVHSPFREDGHARERAPRADNPIQIHIKLNTVSIKFINNLYTPQHTLEGVWWRTHTTSIAIILNQHRIQQKSISTMSSSRHPAGGLPILKKAMDGVRSPKKVQLPDEDSSHHPWLSYFRIIKKPWMA